ncbi:hypothetical protein ACFWEJ_03260, partial [Promicromonospora sp. NPDC060204]
MTTVPVMHADDPADGKMPDDAWLAALFAEGDALFGEREPRFAPDVPGGPDWFDMAPDEALSHGPVALWPVEVLRQALAREPGAELARVVAECTGLDAATRSTAGVASRGVAGVASRSTAGVGSRGTAGVGSRGVAGVASRSTAGVASRGAADAARAAGPAAVAADGHVVAEAGSAPFAALSDDLLGQLAGACARLQSWAAGVQALVVGERAAREASPLAHNSLVGQ